MKQIMAVALFAVTFILVQNAKQIPGAVDLWPIGLLLCGLCIVQGYMIGKDTVLYNQKLEREKQREKDYDSRLS